MTGLLDAQGNKQSQVIEKTFENGSSSVEDTYIDEAVVVGDNTVKLTFNKEIALDVPNVLNTNYSISYEIDGDAYTKTPVSANYINATTLIVTFNQLDRGGTEYEVTYNKLIDYSGIETDNLTGKYMETVEW